MVDKTKETGILIQVNPQSGAVVAQGATEDFVLATHEKLQSVSQLVKTGWVEMMDDISRMENPPAEFCLEFGIDVGAEAGVPFITKGSMSANFKVSITWHKADS